IKVPAPLIVKGLTLPLNSPTVCTTVFVLVSAIDIVLEPRPARNAFVPSRLTMVLCAPSVAGVWRSLINLPVAASTMYQCGPPNEGTHNVLPSELNAMRSQQLPS